MTKTANSLTIGEITDSIENVITATKLVGAQRFSVILTDTLYSSNDPEFLEMLVLAGERAKNVKQDIWQEANKDRIFEQREVHA